MTSDDINGSVDGIQPEAPEPATALDDVGALEVSGDLFTPGEPVNVAPLDSTTLTVAADDLLEPRPEPPPPVVPLESTGLPTEKMADLFESPPAPEARVASATPQEAVALVEPPTIEEPQATSAASPEQVPLESSVLTLAADLKRLAAELSDFAADPS
jgi:hypothetical protein